MKKKESIIQMISKNIKNKEDKTKISKEEIKKLKFKSLIQTALPFITIGMLFIINAYITKYQPVLNNKLNIIAITILVLSFIIAIPLIIIYALRVAYMDIYASKLDDLNIKEERELIDN